MLLYVIQLTIRKIIKKKLEWIVKLIIVKFPFAFWHDFIKTCVNGIFNPNFMWVAMLGLKFLDKVISLTYIKLELIINFTKTSSILSLITLTLEIADFYTKSKSWTQEHSNAPNKKKNKIN